MTNFEKYKDEILRVCNADIDFAIKKNTNEIVGCRGMKCTECKFSDGYGCCNISKYTWMHQECKKSVTLDDFTKELLRKLYNAGWKYIAKSEVGNVHVYKNKPTKACFTWGVWDSSYATSMEIHSDIAKFDFLSWDDEEPVEIKDLIGGDNE